MESLSSSRRSPDRSRRFWTLRPAAARIQVKPDGSKAYVACTPDNYVVVVDLKPLEVTEHFDAGKQPDGMA